MLTKLRLEQLEARGVNKLERPFWSIEAGTTMRNGSEILVESDADVGRKHD